MKSRPAAIIKVCGVTNREDALEAEAAGATAIGFNFYAQSPRYIEPAEAARIGAALAGIVKVGVFVREDPGRVVRICVETGMDVAQLHGGEGNRALTIWRACRVPASGEFQFPDDGEAEALLLDAASETLAGGTGTTFLWRVARGAGGRPVIVAGGLDASNVGQAIREAQPWGVDACSRIENRPGRKDHQKMREFIRTARAEFSL